MAGRYVLREPPLSNRAPPTHHLPSLHHLEDRIAIQQSEIQSLLLDNQRLAATHVALKQELSLAQQDLRRFSSTAAGVKAERDAEVREVYDKSLKLDAEARVIESMRAEIDRVRADVEKLGVIKRELTMELDEINDELAKGKAESKDVAAIKVEIETEWQEIQRGRAAIECEKKNHASNLEQREIMEKNMITVAHQIERLRGELANAEKRAKAAAAANLNSGYAASYGNPDTGHGMNLYADPYSMHQIWTIQSKPLPVDLEENLSDRSHRDFNASSILQKSGYFFGGLGILAAHSLLSCWDILC